MRFYFDFDESVFCDEYAPIFTEAIKQEVVSAIADEIYSRQVDTDKWFSAVSKQIDTIVKEHSNDIIEAVVDRVSEKIAAKKALIALTPKASELAAIDKDNIAYFEKMVDKAIAKRFK